jgi:ABC-type bacteriocin/lantibiotic exporter with double-glycine peptidase domain
MVAIMAFLDVAGVASIMPFIALIANPQLISSNQFTNYLRSVIEFQSSQDFLLFLGALVFLALLISLSFKALTTYAQTRFALMCECSIAKRLVEGYLNQPYSWFLNRNSAELGKTVLSEVEFVIGFGLLPLMTLVTQGAVALALLALLLFIDPFLALCVGVVLSIAYGCIFAVMGRWLKRLGESRTQANIMRFTAVNEAFGAIKELKAGGLERVYINRFAFPAEIYAKGQGTAIIIGQLPRYLLEAIAFGGILLLALYLLAKTEGIGAALPIIALYAFTGYRIMPALQQAYGAITQLRYVGPALSALNSDLNSLGKSKTLSDDLSPMPLTREILLKNIVYSYPSASTDTLKGIDLSIRAHSTTAFVGATGCGKTTVVDVILGLLEPQQGILAIDNETITSANRRRWQRTIGYVPQNIYLIDDSIAANIAFGTNAEDINREELERCAKIANVHDFIVNQLPQGYNTMVGERGVRLSGGQRQRIGIARALYKKPTVLILDEATSALDNLTAEAVMDALNNLGREMTVILIAHRISSVRKCDQIYHIELGQVKINGTYEELAERSNVFAAMINKS